MCKDLDAGVDSATEAVSTWLSRLSEACDQQNVESLAGLFAPDCYWRDLVAFTWNIKTMEGRGAIGDMLTAVLGQVKPHGWAVKDRATTADGVIEAWITFETSAAQCLGYVRLRAEGCWTLFTAAQSLRGHEELQGPTRVYGGHRGAVRHRESWADQRERERAAIGHEVQPYVVIVGGSQAGIALGARLKRLGVPTIILERTERAGDMWRNRYKALCLHDPVGMTHLPYIPFPEHWPLYAPKDMVADWLEMYVKIMELDYWTMSTCTAATWDDVEKQWTVTVDRGGEAVELKPKQLVIATGNYGLPNMPEVPGMGAFQGGIIHSSKYTCGADYAGKRVVVVGSNTSAHDICQDLWEHGAEVTMVQRSPTTICSVDTLRETLVKDYSDEAKAAGLTTEMADLQFASIPYKVLGGRMQQAWSQIRERDAELLEGLGRAGFLLDHGEDETGVFMKFLRRGTGFYFDTGASGLIACGSVVLKTGQVVHLSEAGVVLDGGSHLPADAVVFATGYGPMTGMAAQFLGDEVAKKLGRVWGLGSGTRGDPGPWEGELRNMWKPTRQEGLWLHGGNLLQSRTYSHYLALQLKALQVGLPVQVYGLELVRSEV